MERVDDGVCPNCSSSHTCLQGRWEYGRSVEENVCLSCHSTWSAPSRRDRREATETSVVA